MQAAPALDRLGRSPRPDVDGPPPLPAARGPLTEALFRALRRTPGPLPAPPDLAPIGWDDDDFQLALYACYELHYRSFAGIDDRWEWEPALLQWRSALEARFDELVRAMVGPVPVPERAADALRAAVDDFDGPSLSRHVEQAGTVEQFREFAVHRSAYQLKEADPHTWAAPRLSGRPKAALLHIQYEEYGNGVAADMHARLFADVMDHLGLDPAYGAYLDHIPAVTLGTVNLVSYLGLHRRLRGALVGHLALFEMTSVTPMTRYSRALRRLGLDGATRFYDVHVEADAEHEVIALDEMVATLAQAEPALAADIVFGARAALAVEDRFARHLLDSWRAGATSLRRPL